MKASASRRVVITRSREGNAELAPKLEAMGLQVVSLDLLTFAPPKSWAEIDSRIKRLETYDWLVFTSSTGVRFLLERMVSAGLHLPDGMRPRIGAVGDGTAGALSASGVRVDFVPERYLTKELAQRLPGPPGRVLLLRTDRAEKEMVLTLENRGFSVEDVVVYRTLTNGPVDVAELLDSDVVVFGSPSAVEALCSGLTSSVLSRIAAKTAACIGPVTGAAARKYGFKNVIEPPLNTFDSLLQIIGREAQLA